MNVTRTFRLRIHDHGTTTPSDATVYFTLSLSDMASPPVLPGPIVRPFQGKTETQGWAFEVIDNAGIVTSRLASGGRMHLLGRIVTVEMQEDGGAWQTIGTARLANLTQPRGPGLYMLSLEDERWKERNSYIFTRSDTTSLWPQGLRYPFRLHYTAVTPATVRVRNIFGNVVQLTPVHPTSLFSQATQLPEGYKVTRAVQDLMTSDATVDRPLWVPTATEGSFETLRAHVDGVEMEILFFAQHRQIVAGPAYGTLEVVADDEGFLMPFNVIWVGTMPALDDTFTVTITAAEHEPTTALPYHVGVKNAAHEWGSTEGLLHPFDALERAYTQAGVRFDPVAMATLQADPRYAKSGWRITSTRKLAEWAEEAIYKPNLVVPFVDNEGRLAPRAVDNPEAIDPTTLFVFDASNTRAPHVTWHHGVRDAFNIATVQYQEERFVVRDDMPDGSPLPTDRIDVREREIPLEYDTVDELGPRGITVRMDGLHRGSGLLWLGGDIAFPASGLLRDNAERFANELFEVAGDGPQTGTIHGMLATGSVASGDLAIIDQDSLKNPNPAANARSGSRIVRILQRTFHVNGYEFEYMDIGPELQPLAEPTIAIAQNVDDPVHTVDVTVSGVPAGALATVLIGTDAALTDLVRQLVGVGDGTYVVRGMPADTTIFAAGYSHQSNRTRSLLSTPVSVTTDAEGVQVRTFTATLQDDGSVLVEWTVSPATLGLRLAYEAHAADATPTLPDFVDVDASLGEYEFAAGLVTGEEFSVGATPYPGFAAGAVSGTAGDQIVQTVSTPQDTEWETVVETIPQIASFGLESVGSSAVVSWPVHTPTTHGVRLYYSAHSSDNAPAFSSFVDVDVDDGGFTFDSTYIGGAAAFSVQAEPYTGFSGGAVTGSVGIRTPVRTLIFSVPVSGDTLAPFVTFTRTASSEASETVLPEGHLQTGQAGPLNYRLRITDDTTFTDATGWTAWTAGAIPSIVIARDPQVAKVLWVQVRDGAAGLASELGAHRWTVWSEPVVDMTGVLQVPLPPLHVTTANLQNEAVTAAKLAAQAVETAKILDAAITADKIEAGAVTETKLADLAVTAGKVASSAITTAKLANDAVTAGKIADDAVGTEHIQALAVTAAEVADSAITTAKVADNAVVAGKLAANAVTEDKILDRAVTALKVGEKVISTQHLVVGSFDNLVSNPGFETTGVFAPHTVQAGGGTWSVAASLARSGSCAVFAPAGQTGTAIINVNGAPDDADAHHAVAQGDRIYFGAWIRCGDAADANRVQLAIQWRTAAGVEIPGSESTNTAVEPTQTYARVSHTATAPATAAYAVARVFILNDGHSINGIRIDDLYMRRMVEGSIVVDGTIATRHLEADSVTAEKIAASAVEAEQIAAGAVTTAKLDALAVTAEKIAAGAITTAKMDAGAVTADKIAANTITAAQIAADAITASEIAANAVTAAKINALAVTTAKIAAGAVTADKITVANLAAITADIGTIVAGTLNSAESSPAAGVRLNSGYAKPASWLRYLDLAATGSDPFLFHDGLSLLADGEALFAGGVTITQGHDLTVQDTSGNNAAVISAPSLTAARFEWNKSEVAYFEVGAESLVGFARIAAFWIHLDGLVLADSLHVAGSEVSFGPNDSGGAGYRVLRVPNV